MARFCDRLTSAGVPYLCRRKGAAIFNLYPSLAFERNLLKTFFKNESLIKPVLETYFNKTPCDAPPPPLFFSSLSLVQTRGGVSVS